MSRTQIKSPLTPGKTAWKKAGHSEGEKVEGRQGDGTGHERERAEHSRPSVPWNTAALWRSKGPSGEEEK